MALSINNRWEFIDQQLLLLEQKKGLVQAPTLMIKTTTITITR